jgi:hypothetical protein
MNPPHRKADSLDRIEVLMALEEVHCELTPAFKALWKLDPDFDESGLFPRPPYIAAPFMAQAQRNGFETTVTVFARSADSCLARDHDCGQFAIGTLQGSSRLVEGVSQRPASRVAGGMRQRLHATSDHCDSCAPERHVQ